MAGFLAALAPVAAVLGTPAALVASAVPAKHASQPAALTLQATFELQCGRAGDVAVGLPGALHWRSLTASAVTVNGIHPLVVKSTAQHVVQITMGPPRGVICDSIGPGRVTVRFTRAAGLVNPAHAGTYAVWLRARGQTATGWLHIS